MKICVYLLLITTFNCFSMNTKGKQSPLVQRVKSEEMRSAKEIHPKAQSAFAVYCMHCASKNNKKHNHNAACSSSIAHD